MSSILAFLPPFFALLQQSIAASPTTDASNITAIDHARISPYTTIATTTLSPSQTEADIILTESGGNATTEVIQVTGTPVYLVVSGSTTVAVPTRSELPAISTGEAARELGQSWTAVVMGAIAMAAGIM